MGPSHNDEIANKACQELIDTLAQKYGLYSLRSTTVYKGYTGNSETMNEIKAKRLEEFKKAIHGLFEYDSWEAF